MSDNESDFEHNPSNYPPPLIVEPTAKHRESWIVLHGRGDHAATFVRGLFGFLNMALPDGRTLQQHLPHVRFVFPTASYRRARVFNRSVITQWFDLYSWNSTEKMEWQVEGLRETCEWVDRLVRHECEAVGAANVVVGGLSQGCASTLIWNLLWNGPSVRCTFGMSGWLPFQHVLALYISKSELGTKEEGDIFERSEGENKDPYQAAIGALRQELEIKSMEGHSGKEVPVFLGHGVGDNTVYVDRGKEAADCLRDLGCKVRWTEYEGLSHWFNGEELMDIVKFVEEHKVQSKTEEGGEQTS